MMPGSSGTVDSGRGEPVAEPEVVVGGEQHLGDRVIGAGPDLGHQESGVRFNIDRARVLVRVGGDPDREIAQRAGQLHQVAGVFQALRMRDPFAVRITRRVSAQGQDVAHPDGCVRADHLSQFAHRVADGGQMRDRHQGGLLGDPLGHPDRPLAMRTAGPVGDRHERRPQRFQPADGTPQHVLVRVVPRRHELDGEMWTGRGETVADGWHPRSLSGPDHDEVNRSDANCAGGPR